MTNKEVEIISCNRTDYNRRMSESASKYKIYLDENTKIVDDSCIEQILRIFKNNPDIGIIGLSGAEVMSTHGIALQSAKRCGKIFIGDDQQIMSWSEINGDYQIVDAVDGFFMATQYDIPWNNNFDDEVFANSAQCVEFRRRGYKSAVLKQEKPSIKTSSKQFTINPMVQNAFLDKYSKDLFPKILILIPTFNRSKYLSLALDSVINQTYKNLKIVVSDDSTDDETEKLIHSYIAKEHRIKYFHHHGFSADDNWNFLRKYQMDDECEYVNWLMDDDIFLPRKLELMVEAYRNNPDVSPMGA